jgi:hypothetical protein
MRRVGAFVIVALWAIGASGVGLAAEKNMRLAQIMAGDELDDRYWSPDPSTTPVPDVGPWDQRPVAAPSDGPPQTLDDGGVSQGRRPVPNGHSVADGGSLESEHIGDAVGVRPAPELALEQRIDAMMARLGAPPSPELPGFGVHIATFRTPERALRAWQELKALHGDVFGPLSPRIVAIDLGSEGGKFFQLYAGPIPDREAAQLLCGDIERRNLYCEPTIF